MTRPRLRGGTIPPVGRLPAPAALRHRLAVTLGAELEYARTMAGHYRERSQPPKYGTQHSVAAEAGRLARWWEEYAVELEAWRQELERPAVDALGRKASR